MHCSSSGVRLLHFNCCIAWAYAGRILGVLAYVPQLLHPVMIKLFLLPNAPHAWQQRL